MVELAILVPFIFWSIDNNRKNNDKYEVLNADIKDIQFSVHTLSQSIKNQIENTEIRLEANAMIIEKIWNKLE